VLIRKVIAYFQRYFSYTEPLEAIKNKHENTIIHLCINSVYILGIM
jgi:hypothetical protein